MGYKNTEGKEKLRFVPRQALVEIARVREFGNAKYGCPNGWRLCDRDDFVEAAMRHIVKYFDGEELDPESGLSHLSHAVCSLALGISVPKQDNKSNEKSLEAFYGDDGMEPRDISVSLKEWEESLSNI